MTAFVVVQPSSNFADYYDFLMPELNGITTPMVDLHLRQVAIDFCRSTKAWKMPFVAVDTVAGTDTYSIASADDTARTVKVLKLTVNSILLFDDGYQETRMTATEPKYARDDPPFTMSIDLSQIVLTEDEIPTSAVVNGLEATGCFQPKVTASALPEFLLTEHLEAMRTGTLARLMAMAARPWSNPAQASLYMTAYSQAKGFAASEATNGNTRKLLRTKKWG